MIANPTRAAETWLGNLRVYAPFAVLLLGGVGWLLKRYVFGRRPKSAGQVTIGPSTQSSVVANTGTVRDVHVYPQAPSAPLDTPQQAAVGLSLIVSTTNRRLQDIIGLIDNGSFTSPAARQALADARGEFFRERARFVASQVMPFLRDVEQWEDDIQRACDEIHVEEDAWTRSATMGVPGSLELPGRKRIGEFRDLLARGEKLEEGIRKLTVEAPPSTEEPPEVRLTRERIAGGIELTVGQLKTLSNRLQWLRTVTQAEAVLRDLEILATEFSRDDLRAMGDAGTGTLVIGYYRDVRTTVDRVRELAKVFERTRTLSDAEERLRSSMQQCQALVAENIRSGDYLVEQIRALK